MPKFVSMSRHGNSDPVIVNTDMISRIIPFKDYCRIIMVGGDDDVVDVIATFEDLERITEALDAKGT